MYKKIYSHFIAIVFLLCSNITMGQSPDQEKVLSSRFQELDSLSQIYRKENNIDAYLNTYFEMLELAPQLKSQPVLPMQFHKKQGVFFQNIGLSEEALKNNQKTLEYLAMLDDAELKKHYSLHTRILGQNAGNYLDAGMIDSAAQEFKDAVRFTASDKNLWPIAEPSALNNLGHFFQNTLHEYDSALYYYHKADSILLADFDPGELLIGSVRDNIATVYVAQGKYELAKTLFKENFSFFDVSTFDPKRPQFERWTRAGIQWAEMEIKLNHHAEAKAILDSVQNILNQYDFFHKQKAIIRYLKGFEAYSYSINDDSTAYNSLTLRVRLLDSITTRQHSNEHKWSHQLHELAFHRSQESFLSKKEQLKTTREKERLQLLIAIGILLIGIASVIYFYRQSLKDVKQKNLISDQQLQLKKLENEILHQNIELKKRDLSDFALNYVLELDWAQILFDKLTLFKRSRGQNRTKALKELEAEIENKIKLKKNNPELYEKVDLLSSEFYIKLKKECPGLSKSEIRLCSLIRLKLESSHIAQLLNINPTSLHQARYRLRKKLELDSSTSLDEFCQKL